MLRHAVISWRTWMPSFVICLVINCQPNVMRHSGAYETLTYILCILFYGINRHSCLGPFDLLFSFQTTMHFFRFCNALISFLFIAPETYFLICLWLLTLLCLECLAQCRSLLLSCVSWCLYLLLSWSPKPFDFFPFSSIRTSVHYALWFFRLWWIYRIIIE